ncbi:alcohol oxidase [Auricularia subglabra TFB-10046 SS5]|nr:alcohol oxidase [Auricularia subglabra TFB-10046 SS5]
MLFPVCLALSSALPSLAATVAASSSYDFIVVGGGTAGLALSARLSKLLPKSKILVIEAGPAAPDEPGINIPGLDGSTFNSRFDWNMTTIPQPDVDSRQLAHPRGHVLGGSSALNFMTWDRASAPEYDSWATAPFGGPGSGWEFETFFPTMLRVENFTAPSEPGVYGDTGVGHTGPIQTLVNPNVPAAQAALLPTLIKLGIPNNTLSNDGHPIGADRQPSAIRGRDWTRSYSTSYLPLAGANLKVQTDTRVAKVNFKSGKTLVATGVTLEDGTVLTANKEVIISAGAFQSPQLIELSGIGNKKILGAAGIETLLDLPGVGENLQDHIRVQNVYELKPGIKGRDELIYNVTFAAEQRALYDAGVRGSVFDYTGSSYGFLKWAHTGVDVNATVASSATSSPIDQAKLAFLKDATVPDIELILSDGYAGAKAYPAPGTPGFGRNFFTITAGVMHTFALGSVHVNASAPRGLPVIDPKYLSNAYDLAAVGALAQYLRTVAETSPLRDVVAAEFEPGPGVQTPAQWTAYAKEVLFSIWHPMGTCAMMTREEGGVVGPTLVVHGTTNLRVVDASIMPVQIAAHIQSGTYGIAERAAVFIADAWKA